jgi:hypothetical protein
MAECFPASDHQLLTNRGFLYIEQLLALLELPEQLCDTVLTRHDWRGLRIASYDARRQALVYETPLRLIVRAARPDEFIQLSNDVDDDDQQIDVVVTPGHELYVAPSSSKSASPSSSSFRKVEARHLLSHQAPLHVLTAADNGLSSSSSSSPLSYLSKTLPLPAGECIATRPATPSFDACTSMYNGVDCVENDTQSFSISQLLNVEYEKVCKTKNSSLLYVDIIDSNTCHFSCILCLNCMDIGFDKIIVCRRHGRRRVSLFDRQHSNTHNDSRGCSNSYASHTAARSTSMAIRC